MRQAVKNEELGQKIQRMIYKGLLETDPKKVADRLKSRKVELYEAVSKELSESEARDLANKVFWWVKDEV